MRLAHRIPFGAITQLVSCLLLSVGCTTIRIKEPTIHDDLINRTCPSTILIIAEEVTEGWTTRDDEQVLVSRKRCKQLYGDSSCLHKLTKVGPMRYTVICRPI